MYQTWVSKQIDGKVPEGLHANPHVARLLFQRGIRTREDADRFFHPNLNQLHDPFLMKDMDKAVERLQRALTDKERICVYGDYDVDGITAVALVYSFLEKIMPDTEDLGFFIPDRYLDGYGLSKRGIDYAQENGVSLMIVLDCGIKANEEVLYAKEKGIDVIVCDHHFAEGEIPQAYAVLDPKREDCPYPYKDLSGCGVGLKLVWAYALKNNMDLRQHIYPLLDLAAMSIASDIVPILGENRVLSYFGLMLINTRPRPGVFTLFNYANIKAYNPAMNRNQPAPLARGSAKSHRVFDREITNNDLVFSLGPRINAAGRVQDGKTAVRLLLCRDLSSAQEVAKLINDNNNNRKNLDKEATEDAFELISQDLDDAGKATTVVFKESWNQGIIGIVASRLIETYYRPTIVFTTAANGSQDSLVGSARSVKGFNIYEAISACGHLLEHYGGHKYAAGLTIKLENFEKFKELFEDEVKKRLNGEELQREIEIDDELLFEEINQELVNTIKNFAPFGPRNLNPIFASKHVKAANTPGVSGSRIVGNNHLKLMMFQPESRSEPIDGIAFQQGEAYARIKEGNSFDICYHLEENTFNGNTSIQLNIQDIRFR
ncbi:MAG: DHHA1 domain-containing protein [Bacteroides sp.]|nr:DHHA1 domain-containing protein [Ruminococcus flavefaciens]MCM1555149.1 DHHA1 domain-containing protein [Bacteroides sp.]